MTQSVNTKFNRCKLIIIYMNITTKTIFLNKTLKHNFVVLSVANIGKQKFHYLKKKKIITFNFFTNFRCVQLIFEKF